MVYHYWVKKNSESGTCHMMAETVDKLSPHQKIRDNYGEEWEVDFEMPKENAARA